MGAQCHELSRGARKEPRWKMPFICDVGSIAAGTFPGIGYPTAASGKFPEPLEPHQYKVEQLGAPRAIVRTRRKAGSVEQRWACRPRGNCWESP